MLRKLRVRLVVSHALPIIILTPLISLFLLYLLESHYSLGNVANQLIDQGTLIAEFTQDNGATWSDAKVASDVIGMIDPPAATRVMLIDKEGHLLASSLAADSTRVGQKMSYPAVQQALSGQTSWLVDYSPVMRTRIIDMGMPVLADDGSLIGVVRLSYDITELEQKTVPLVGLVVGTIVVGTCMALLLGILLARSLSSSLSHLTRAVQALSPDTAAILLPETGPDELRILAQSYNQMVRRLHTAESERQQLLANVVHELGTPLGAIKAAAQALENGAVPSSQVVSELAIGISSQVDQLSLLIDDLTLLDQTNSHEIPLTRQWVNLDDLLQVQCQSYTYLAQQKQIELRYELHGELPPAFVDPNRMCQIVANLLHNACKYTPPQGRITVAADVEYTADTLPTICIQVSDTGPGIEVGEQEKIFVLLYRGARERNLYKGMGIGLALSRRLAEVHDGSLTVESVPGQGSTFTLRLPIKAAERVNKLNLPMPTP